MLLGKIKWIFTFLYDQIIGGSKDFFCLSIHKSPVYIFTVPIVVSEIMNPKLIYEFTSINY